MSGTPSYGPPEILNYGAMETSESTAYCAVLISRCQWTAGGWLEWVRR